MGGLLKEEKEKGVETNQFLVTKVMAEKSRGREDVGNATFYKRTWGKCTAGALSGCCCEDFSCQDLKCWAVLILYGEHNTEQ